MVYGICRIQKLKAGNLKPSLQHTRRKRFTPNANPEKEHICIIGEEKEELDSLVRNRIGNQSIRKNAVLAVEILLSASPEYFRPDDRSEAGYYEPSRLEYFQTAACQWLSETYGDRIVLAYLHLDEATPHIHAYLVPLDERGKLNCRGLFGTRSKLSQLQDSFALAMSQIGLERGIKGSKATHTQIQKYYTAVTQAPNLTLSAADIQHQLADRGRILKENAELQLTVGALAKQLKALNRHNLELEVSLASLKLELEAWQQKYRSLACNQECIPLSLVAHQLGLSPDNRQVWRNHDKALKITDTKFSTLSESPLKAGSSALDLVMTVLDCTFSQAVIFLNDRFGQEAASQSVGYYALELIKQAPAKTEFKNIQPEKNSRKPLERALCADEYTKQLEPNQEQAQVQQNRGVQR
ncbi:MobV family relaxase [Brasilonema sp. UFV-L1]|uniref:MobV family relaxase n=1 Tax=Brasilonema sp. UFV-L1 TaxID=2234130 RepID=UPI00145EF6A0|nr:MobV family relaxase [Brasilonema sp. UFV-L1]NMG11263.1 plasmid recombination enzyme [Brasilonema sp. UFV-L1]